MKRILFTLAWIALIGSAAAAPRWNVSPRAAPRAVADATVTVTPQEIASAVDFDCARVEGPGAHHQMNGSIA
jgi:hypothetical protein